MLWSYTRHLLYFSRPRDSNVLIYFKTLKQLKPISLDCFEIVSERIGGWEIKILHSSFCTGTISEWLWINPSLIPHMMNTCSSSLITLLSLTATVLFQTILPGLVWKHSNWSSLPLVPPCSNPSYANLIKPYLYNIHLISFLSENKSHQKLFTIQGRRIKFLS